jgi:hypothetical protein
MKNLPNFPRSSQNQTVSSGVEGAHEGTTADKSHGEGNSLKPYYQHAGITIYHGDCRQVVRELDSAHYRPALWSRKARGLQRLSR